MVRVLTEHGFTNPRIFGSVARSQATDSSDVDLIVDSVGAPTLYDLVRCQAELSSLLKANVDLVTTKSLEGSLRSSVLGEALPL